MPHELMHSPPPPIGLLRMIEAELKKEANRQLQLLKEQAMAKVAEIINQVPYLIYIPPKTFQIDKEGIKELLLGYACVPPSSDIVAKVKNQAIGVIDQILEYQQPIRDLLDRIHAKVEQLLTGLVNFDNLFKILKPMQKIYSRIHLAIFITVQVAPLQFLTGGAFAKLLELKKTFSRGNKMLKAIIFALQKAKEFLKKLIRDQLKVLVDQARAMIQKVVDFIEQIKTMIELYYLQYLALCENVVFPPEGLEAQINSLLNNASQGFGIPSAIDDFFLGLLNDAKDNALFLREVFNANFEKIGVSVISKNKLAYFLQLAESNADLINLNPNLANQIQNLNPENILNNITFPNLPNFPDVVIPPILLDPDMAINYATELGSTYLELASNTLSDLDVPSTDFGTLMANTVSAGIPGNELNNIINQYNVITNPINNILGNFNIGGGAGLPDIPNIGGGGY